LKAWFGDYLFISAVLCVQEGKSYTEDQRYSFVVGTSVVFKLRTPPAAFCESSSIYLLGSDKTYTDETLQKLVHQPICDSKTKLCLLSQGLCATAFFGSPSIASIRDFLTNMAAVPNPYVAFEAQLGTMRQGELESKTWVTKAWASSNDVDFDAVKHNERSHWSLTFLVC
jgi:hypothetical protein